MKVNVTQVLANFDGKALLRPVDGDQIAHAAVTARDALLTGDVDAAKIALNGMAKPEPLTLRHVACQALMTIGKADDAMPGDKKIALFSLAKRMYEQDEPDIGESEATLLKDRINMFFGPAVVAPAWCILNGVIDKVKAG